MARLFKDIIDCLNNEDIINTAEDWHTKSAWLELMKKPKADLSSLVNFGRIVETIKGVTNEFCDNMVNPQACGCESFGLLRKIMEKRTKPEDRLERLLVASVNNLYNRFNFLSGLMKDENDEYQTKHMTVDLVEADKQRIKAFIELKWEGNNENPLSAMSQIVMYYFLYEKVRKLFRNLTPFTKRGFNLIVLAPRGYYTYFSDNGNDKELLSNISFFFKKELNIKCTFKELPSKLHGVLTKADEGLKSIAHIYRSL